MSLDRCVGVDLGQTKVIFYAEDGGRVFKEKRLSGPAYTKEQFRADVESFVASLPFRPRSVGIACPTLVNDNAISHSVERRDLIGFSGSDFKEYPVFLINDIRAATLEERQHYPPDSSLTVIVNGTGIAAGIIEGGVPYTGCRGWSGELGFIPMKTPEGIVHSMYAMCGRGVMDRAGCPIDEFLRRLEADDPAAKHVIEECSFYFGLCLARYLALFNPEFIVLAGTTMTFKGYREHALEVAQRHTPPHIWESCTICEPRNNELIVTLGARLFGLQKTLELSSAPSSS